MNIPSCSCREIFTALLKFNPARDYLEIKRDQSADVILDKEFCYVRMHLISNHVIVAYVHNFSGYMNKSGARIVSRIPATR